MRSLITFVIVKLRDCYCLV